MNKKFGLIAGVLVLAAALCSLWFWSHRSQTPPPKPLTVVGVGLYVARNEAGKFQITRIFPNSPGEKAGLVPGVLLNRVDGVLAEPKDIKQLSKLLTGPVGSKVVLEIIDANGNTNNVEIVREQFINHSTY